MSSDTRRAFRCPDPLWSRYQHLAEQRGSTVDELVCEAMREYAERQKGLPGGVPEPPPARERRSTPLGSPLRGSGATQPPPATAASPQTPNAGAVRSPAAAAPLGKTLTGPHRPQTPRTATLPLGSPRASEPRIPAPRAVPSPPQPAEPRRDAGRPPAVTKRPPPPSAGVAPYNERNAEAATPPEVPVSRRAGSWDSATTPASVAPNSLETTPVPGTERARQREEHVEVVSQEGRAAPAAPTGWVLTIEFMGATFPVLKERYIIGRDKHTCDLTIKDPNVSRQHAMIEYSNGRYSIVDLGSTNGIELQGQKVTRHTIGHGDVFAVCDHEFRFTYRYSQ